MPLENWSAGQGVYPLQVYTYDVRGAEAPPVMTYMAHRPLQRALLAAARKEAREGALPCAWHQSPLDADGLALRSQANKCVACNPSRVALWDARLAAAACALCSAACTRHAADVA